MIFLKYPMRILRQLQEVSFGITIFFTRVHLQIRSFFEECLVAHFIIAFSREYGLNLNALKPTRQMHYDQSTA